MAFAGLLPILSLAAPVTAPPDSDSDSDPASEETRFTTLSFYQPAIGRQTTADGSAAASASNTQTSTPTSSSSGSSFGNFSGFSGPSFIGREMKLGQTSTPTSTMGSPAAGASEPDSSSEAGSI